MRSRRSCETVITLRGISVSKASTSNDLSMTRTSNTLITTSNLSIGGIVLFIEIHSIYEVKYQCKCKTTFKFVNTISKCKFEIPCWLYKIKIKNKNFNKINLQSTNLQSIKIYKVQKVSQVN